MLIPTAENTKTLTDIRENTLQVLDEVNRQGFIYLFQRSDPRAVVMSIEKFRQVIEATEDSQDEREVLELALQKRGRLIPLKNIRV